MAIDTMKADLEAITESLKGTPESAEGLKAFLQNELVPFLENVVDEVIDASDDIQAIVEGSESILQEDDAAVFAAAITTARQVASELAKRIAAGPAQPTDAQWKKRLVNFNAILMKAQALVEEITVQVAPEGEGAGPLDQPQPANDQEPSNAG